MLLKGKTGIITGAARGIGKAIALRFAKEGANIVLNDINSGGIEGGLREIEDLGGAALAVTAALPARPAYFRNSRREMFFSSDIETSPFSSIGSLAHRL